MSKIRKYIFPILQLVIFILSLISSWYAPLTIALVILLLVQILDKLGKGIVLREMIAFHSCFVTIVMPMIGYALFTRNNSMARLWVRYMPVPEDVYFNFALPSMTLFVLAICFPIDKKDFADEGPILNGILAKVKATLQQPAIRRNGIYIVVIGIIMLFIAGLLPAPVRFISVLFYFSSFAGILYVFYSASFRYKVPLLVVFIIFIIAEALRSGMFTVLAYMGITIFSFLFAGRKFRFWKKAVLFIAGGLALMLIQSVKPTFRNFTWVKGYEGNKASLFIDLLVEKVSKGEVFSDDTFFWIYYRTNQGFNVGLVMRRVPRIQAHDGGTNLLRSAAASVVPRILWPDKPEAGGKFNMKYYTGVTLRGWSTNIGPLGEAYGGFGVKGGMLYMFILGLFIRWAYLKVFVIAKKIPLLICWLPVLFYQVSYSAETDTLQILNSLIKSSFFIWLLYKFVPTLFGIVKTKRFGFRSYRPA